MGSSLKPKSTRARRGRSDNSPPKPSAPIRPATTATKGNPRGTASADAVQALRDGPAAEALSEIHRVLDHAQSVVIVCGGALKHEGTPYAMDVALCLRLFVSNELDRQMERIDALLGRERRYESSVKGGGDE